ncbi:MFS transporter [Schaalia georgiae]|uniref:MFS transporter n=2 Tax=Schaalia georgiae TaxID=52768 RepID=UPI00047DC6DB|nr:MFS transporter [Schaalia georgiae]
MLSVESDAPLQNAPASGDAPAARPEPFTPRQWGILGVLTLAVMLLAIDGSVLSLAVPSLSADLDPTANQILWIGDIYSFAIAGLLVTVGNIADRYGRKRTLLVGATGFAVASLLCALSPDANVLILGRFLLGVFGAAIMPSTLSIVRDTFDDPCQRTRAIAIWSIGTTGGAALGPLLGGFLIEHFRWSSVFFINLPIMVLVLAVGVPMLRESYGNREANVDIASSVLSILTIVPIVYVVKEAAHGGFGWPQALALALGTASGWAFVRRQRRLEHPLLDLGLFRIPAFSGAVLTAGIAIFALVGLLYFFSQYLQLVRGMAPLAAGLVEMPATVTGILAALTAPRLLPRLGQGGAIALGTALLGVGMGIVAAAESVPGIVLILVGVGILGFGSGLSMTLSTDAIVGAAPTSRAGAASAISETAYELGAACGIAVLGSVLSSYYRWFVALPDDFESAHGAGASDSLARTLEALGASGTAGADGVPPGGSDPVLAEAARLTFAHGMQATAVFAVLLCLAAALVAWRAIPSGPARTGE